MILLTSYTYANPGYTIEDADLIPVTIIEHGKTIDDIIPALSDDIAQTLAVNNGVTIEDNDGNTIEPDVQSVCEAVANGTTTVLVHRAEETDVYTVNYLTIRRKAKNA